MTPEPGGGSGIVPFGLGKLVSYSSTRPGNPVRSTKTPASGRRQAGRPRAQRRAEQHPDAGVVPSVPDPRAGHAPVPLWGAQS